MTQAHDIAHWTLVAAQSDLPVCDNLAIPADIAEEIDAYNWRAGCGLSDDSGRREVFRARRAEAVAKRNAKQHRAAWLREAVRHQHNAAYCAAMAMHNRDAGNHELACQWQWGADASAHNARCNLFAAMNIKPEAQA